MLAAYLRALDERGGAGMPAFLQANFDLPKDRPSLLAELVREQAKLRSRSGGLDLGGARCPRPNHVDADVRSRRLGTWSRLSLDLAAAPPDVFNRMVDDGRGAA